MQTATPSFQKIEVEVEHKKQELKKRMKEDVAFSTVHDHLNVALASLADFSPTISSTQDEKSWLFPLLSKDETPLTAAFIIQSGH